MVKNSLYQLGLYEKSMPDTLSWVEKLNITHASGFDYLEISIDETDGKIQRLYDTQLQQEILHTIKATGVTIRSMCLSAHRKYSLGSTNEHIREKGIEIFHLAVDMASMLGIRLIQLAGYDVYYEESTTLTRSMFQENLIKCMDYAASKLVMCAFETMETPFMNTVYKSMDYVSMIHNPYCGVYPDLGNLTNALPNPNDLYADIKTGFGHIAAVHLKETVPGFFREIPFGTGHVNFEEGIRAFYQMGVRSYVCECWHKTGEDYHAILKYNNQFLRSYFAEVIYEI